jgi:hypothetical protein
VTTESRDGTARIWDAEFVLPISIDKFLNRFAIEYDPLVPRDQEYEAATEAIRTKRLLRYRKSTATKAIQVKN